MKNLQKQYSEFQKRFKAMSDEELIDTFNGDVGKPVWITARAQFHDALRGEFENRGFDYSSIGSMGKGSFDIGHEIKLIGKKIIKKNMNNLKQPIRNIPTLKARFEYLRGILNPTDKEMKELLHLSEEEFKILDKETNQSTQPVEQANSSAAAPPETALSKYMKKYSHRVENTTQPGTVTQITGCPQPKKAKLAQELSQKSSKTLDQQIEEFNQKYDPNKEVHNSIDPQEVQIILHRKTPVYPKKK